MVNVFGVPGNQIHSIFLPEDLANSDPSFLHLLQRMH